MAETKEPAIKLFGKTIKLPRNEEKILSVFSCRRNGTTCTIINTSNTDCSQSISNSKNELKGTGEDEEKLAEKDSLGNQLEEMDDKDRGPTLVWEKINPQSDNSTTFLDREIEASKSLQNEEGQEEEESVTSDSQGKITSKKPNKILPCPRCASMDTKFCYYNNYNVNQPRYFCKNCQRYWTAGGTMRNVPVGAGRRKNKKSSSSSSHYGHTNVREAQQIVGPVVGPDVFHLQILKPNGPIRTYGADGPLCESMASSLILADRTNGNCTRNGLSVSEEHKISSVPIEESNILQENSAKGRGISIEEQTNFHGFSRQIPLIHGPPLPYTWNSALTQPGLCTQTIAMAFYPATNFWGCPVPSSWNNPLMHPPTNPNPEAPPSYPIPSPNPQALGKHSREGELISKQSILDKEDPRRESNSNRNIWIPKTLRIDDPEEAAKSSIWSTLGIKIDNVDFISGKSLFKAFRLKGDGNSHITETSQLLKANPAALSRSNKFHETS